MKRLCCTLLFAVLLLSSGVEARSKKQTKTALREDVLLPSDFALDFKLGAIQRSNRSAVMASLDDPEATRVGQEVFNTMVGNATVSSIGLPYRWSLSFVNTDVINAGSLPDGEISVNNGLAKLIGTDRGLWAAVLSHEIAHVARRHGVKMYLYRLYTRQLIEYYQLQARLGDKSAPYVLLGLRIAVPIAERKFSRSMENDADVQGMRLMARAGYHPDSVFALHHRLRIAVGEQSKFAAFFQDHPRWETRDQRSEKAYAAALEDYNSLWPDPLNSPGGAAKTVAFAGRGGSKENSISRTADLQLPLYCRNATEPLSLLIHFTKDKHLVQAIDDDHRDRSGNLSFNQQILCTDKSDNTAISVQLPASLVSDKYRKTKATVDVFDSRGELVESFAPFDVHFPKNKGKQAEIITAASKPHVELTAAAPSAAPPKTAESVSPNPAQPKSLPTPSHSVPKPPDPMPSMSPQVPATALTNETNRIETARAETANSGVSTEIANSRVAEVGSLKSDISKQAFTLYLHQSESVPGGVKVIEFSPSGPLGKAGLRPDDVITAVNQQPVSSRQSLETALGRYPQNSKVTLTYMHGAWLMTTSIIIEDQTMDGVTYRFPY